MWKHAPVANKNKQEQHIEAFESCAFLLFINMAIVLFSCVNCAESSSSFLTGCSLQVPQHIVTQWQETGLPKTEVDPAMKAKTYGRTQEKSMKTSLVIQRQKIWDAYALTSGNSGFVWWDSGPFDRTVLASDVCARAQRINYMIF